MNRTYDDLCGVNGCKAIATTYCGDHKRFVCYPCAQAAKAKPKPLVTKPGTKRCKTCGCVMVLDRREGGPRWRHLNDRGVCLEREQAPHVFYCDPSKISYNK